MRRRIVREGHVTSEGTRQPTLSLGQLSFVPVCVLLHLVTTTLEHFTAKELKAHTSEKIRKLKEQNSVHHLFMDIARMVTCRFGIRKRLIERI